MSKTLLYGATKVDETNAAYAAIESLSQFQWKNRVLVIFSDSGNSRAARQENQLLADRPALEERDMIVLKVSGSAVRAVFGSAEPVDAGALRQALDAPDTGTFHAALIGITPCASHNYVAMHNKLVYISSIQTKGRQTPGLKELASNGYHKDRRRFFNGRIRPVQVRRIVPRFC